MQGKDREGSKRFYPDRAAAIWCGACEFLVLWREEKLLWEATRICWFSSMTGSLLSMALTISNCSMNCRMQWERK
jgi:hypothetical protein